MVTFVILNYKEVSNVATMNGFFTWSGKNEFVNIFIIWVAFYPIKAVSITKKSGYIPEVMVEACQLHDQ